jgi:predicted metalloprotease with PDZ domain
MVRWFTVAYVFTALAVPRGVIPAPLGAQIAVAKSPIEYEISFPNANHHEAEITIIYRDLNPGPLELRMSRSSPGRYALHEFAKNVYSVQATMEYEDPLVIERPDPHQWNVVGHRGFVRVTYTLFGDRADGTYSGIDRTHGHLNMPATFMWARGLEERPIQVRFQPAPGSGWRVATQLAPTSDPFLYEAPDLAYFMDSPTLLADFVEILWEVEGPEGGQEFRIALQHDGSAAEAERYAEGTHAIVREAGALFGEYPAFDYGQYTFLSVYLPWVSGDGMEHRNSTVLTNSGSIRNNLLGLLGTVAHEFIHAWNMERIRSDEIQPFDLEAANMSRALWFGEGFTSYLDDLLLRRAGLIDTDEFARRIGGAINTVTNSPGRRFFSPVEMSMQAPFVDAATSVDPTNGGNTFLSYYTWGSVVGLALDLELRTRFPGLSLDHYLRAMWVAYGRTEVPYTLDNLEAMVMEVARGDRAFAREFFGRYVQGGEVPDFGALLAAAGMVLRRSRPESVTIGGIGLRYGQDGATLQGYSTIGTPVYDAGLDRGDRIVELGGRPLRSPADLEAVLEGTRPGDEILVRYVSRGTERSAVIVLVSSPALEVVTFEADGRPLDAGMRTFRENWIEAKAR